MTKALIKNDPRLMTETDLQAAAKRSGIPLAAIKALFDIEAPRGAFNADGTPSILFERHKFYEGLIKIKWITKAKEWAKAYPDICNPLSGGYGTYSAQNARLDKAAKLNRDVALESTSWGCGQVMGFNWQSLGYDSIQHFINKMYESEAAQFEAVLKYIEVNNLKRHILNKNWDAFALGYNGPLYKKNNYATRLAAAYKGHGGT